MRVPSAGLSREERRIVEEGYRFAEHALRGYRDPPPLLVVMVTDWLASWGAMARSFVRGALVRD